MGGTELSSATTPGRDAAECVEPFNALFEEQYPRLLAFAARRVESAADAEDVLAETFAVAWRRRDSIPAEPTPWLYGVARKLIANQRRGRARAQRLANRLATERPDQAADSAGAVEQRSLLHEALAGLGDADREALALTAWEGLDAREAARVMDCSVVAFRVRLHRARRRLRAALADAGADFQQLPTVDPTTSEE